MSENKHEHDFNWMRAYLNCSLDCEFVRLEQAANDATKTRVAALKEQHPDTTIEYRVSSDDHNESFVISVTNKNFPSWGGNVIFTREKDHILVESKTHDDFKPRKVTLTLNNEGYCRYKVDNEPGEYLRWQIIKMMTLAARGESGHFQ